MKRKRQPICIDLCASFDAILLKEEKKTENPLICLPEEILALVQGHLGPHELVSLSQTNKRLCVLMERDQLWTDLFRLYFDSKSALNGGNVSKDYPKRDFVLAWLYANNRDSAKLGDAREFVSGCDQAVSRCKADAWRLLESACCKPSIHRFPSNQKVGLKTRGGTNRPAHPATVFADAPENHRYKSSIDQIKLLLDDIVILRDMCSVAEIPIKKLLYHWDRWVARENSSRRPRFYMSFAISCGLVQGGRSSRKIKNKSSVIVLD